MTYYDVITQPRAERDIEAAYRWLAEQAPAAANEWFDGISDALDSLGEMPERCPIAPEAKHFKQEVRHLLFGAYRIIFAVEERHVRVITVRHASRKPLRRPPRA